MSVLGTKLHLPSPRRRLVRRARITDRLREGGGEGPRLVLVAAPAGFGKTTLLAQWLAAAAGTSQCRVAWLALDPGDADARLFLTDLVAALQTVEPEVGVDALALLESGRTTPTEAFCDPVGCAGRSARSVGRCAGANWLCVRGQ